jgi:hypothetical protein
MKIYNTVTGYIYADRHRTSEETSAFLAPINDWIQTLTGISPYDCGIPAVMEEGLEKGRFKAVLIAELEDFIKSGYYAYVMQKGKHAGEEIVVSFSCEDARVLRLIGFTDEQDRYVGHAYISEEEYGGFVEYGLTEVEK